MRSWKSIFFQFLWKAAFFVITTAGCIWLCSAQLALSKGKCTSPDNTTQVGISEHNLWLLWRGAISCSCTFWVAINTLLINRMRAGKASLLETFLRSAVALAIFSVYSAIISFHLPQELYTDCNDDKGASCAENLDYACSPHALQSVFNCYLTCSAVMTSVPTMWLMLLCHRCGDSSTPRRYDDYGTLSSRCR